MELGQRYSVMVKLDQRPGNYYLRFATYPSGDMQQVLEGRAIVSYSVRGLSYSRGFLRVPLRAFYKLTRATRLKILRRVSRMMQPRFGCSLTDQSKPVPRD